MIATFDWPAGGRHMPSDWEQIVVDSEDPARLARWWAEALGYQIVHEEPGEVEIRRNPETLPGLLFGVSPEPKTAKNRLHVDLRPDDQESEVERLVDMGARPVDIGQRDVSWVVLADPEGNEFCVLSSRRAQ
jgi:predicted enzyme related to lactoylglutathione lyase